MNPARNADTAAERIDRANFLLSQHRYGTEPHEQGYGMLVELADAPGGAWAQWLLGAYHLQVVHRPGSLANALRCLRAAATAGVPQAIERLADLCLQGVALPYSLDGAIEYLSVLAQGGHAPSAWQLAYLADQDNAPDIGASPATLLLRACALGFPAAYYSLGWRCALGRGMARDPTLARALLLRAADAGFRDAREAADALTADAGPATALLHARLRDNLAVAQSLLADLARAGVGAEAAPVVAALETHFVSIGHPAFGLDGDGRACVDAAASAQAPMRDPVELQWVSSSPRIGLMRRFATREECAWLANRVADSLGPLHGAEDGAEFRGYFRPIRPLETDAVMRLLQRRACLELGWSAALLEPGAVLRYATGHGATLHSDAFDQARLDTLLPDSGDPGGQRLAVLSVCLQAPIRGGETEFPGIDLSLRMEPGMAVVHDTLRGGRPDPAARHRERDVLKGEKWLWRTALRARPMFA